MAGVSTSRWLCAMLRDMREEGRWRRVEPASLMWFCGTYGELDHQDNDTDQDKDVDQLTGFVFVRHKHKG